jgi:hypothetical protein
MPSDTCPVLLIISDAEHYSTAPSWSEQMSRQVPCAQQFRA